MNYLVSWKEERSIIIDAINKEEAIGIVRSGDFDQNEVNSVEVDMDSFEAVSEAEAIPEN